MENDRSSFNLNLSSDTNTANSDDSDIFLENYCQKCFQKSDDFSIFGADLYRGKLEDESNVIDFSGRKFRSLESLDSYDSVNYRHDLLSSKESSEMSGKKHSSTDDKVARITKTNVLCFPFKRNDKTQKPKLSKPPSKSSEFNSYGFLNKIFGDDENNDDHCLVHVKSHTTKPERCIHGREMKASQSFHEECSIGQKSTRSKSLYNIERLLDFNVPTGNRNSRRSTLGECGRTRLLDREKIEDNFKNETNIEENSSYKKRGSRGSVHLRPKSLDRDKNLVIERPSNFEQPLVKPLQNNFSSRDSMNRSKISSVSYRNIHEKNKSKSSREKCLHIENSVGHNMLNKRGPIKSYEKSNLQASVHLDGKRLAEWQNPSPILTLWTKNIERQSPIGTFTSNFCSHSCKEFRKKYIHPNSLSSVNSNISTAIQPTQEIKGLYESQSTSSPSSVETSSASSSSFISPIGTPSPYILKHKRRQFKHSSSMPFVCAAQPSKERRRSSVTFEVGNEEITKFFKAREEKPKEQVKENSSERVLGTLKKIPGISFTGYKKVPKQNLELKASFKPANVFPKAPSLNF